MPYFLLSLAPLFWAGNWIVGRAMHESVTPFGLNFGRWSVALIVLALVLAPRWRSVWPAIARSWGRLTIMAACATVIFHSLIYTGLKYTTAVNAVPAVSRLIACSLPSHVVQTPPGDRF